MHDYEQFQKIHEFFIQGKSDLALRLLMQMQADKIALQDRVDMLQARVQEFEDILLLSKALYFDNEFYWLRSDSYAKGPYCPHCYEGDGTLFRLRMQENALYCHCCSSVYAFNAHAVGQNIHLPKPRTATLIPFTARKT